jgi:rhodanese-related sulfurtransferase
MPAPSPRVRFAAVQIALVAAVVAGLWLSYPSWRLGQVADRVKTEYPDLQEITPAKLAAWRGTPKEAQPVVLDARTKEEFAVSHLIDAHRVDAEAPLNPAEDLPDDRNQEIVVYCTTGERSAPFARRLLQAGYPKTLVLEGGIIRWANEGRPMQDAAGSLVTIVHPGDETTAKLLKDAHRADVPVAR